MVLNSTSNAPQRLRRAKRIVDPLGAYAAQLYTLSAGKTQRISAARQFYVLTVLSGRMSLAPGPGGVETGHSVLVPAGVRVSATAGASGLWFAKSWTKARPLSS